MCRYEHPQAHAPHKLSLPCSVHSSPDCLVRFSSQPDYHQRYSPTSLTHPHSDLQNLTLHQLSHFSNSSSQSSYHQINPITPTACPHQALPAHRWRAAAAHVAETLLILLKAHTGANSVWRSSCIPYTTATTYPCTITPGWSNEGCPKR